MSKNKNQHFVPQFYLHSFSVNDDKMTIALLVKQSLYHYNKAKIKNEASRDYFYSKDLRIENTITQIENSLAPYIQFLIQSDNISVIDISTYLSTLLFVSFTYSRNPLPINNINVSKQKLAEHFKKVPLTDELKSKIEDIVQTDNSLQQSLSFVLKGFDYCKDLDIGVVFNKTDTPFITSDFPTILYNQFIENRSAIKTYGFGSRGLQIFLPISPNKMLTFYDPWAYKFGNKKRPKKIVYELENVNDVNSLNLLQVLNSSQKLYFNHLINPSYVLNLIEKSRHFSKPHTAKLKVSGQLIEESQTQLNIKFCPSFFYLTSAAKNHQINQPPDALRPYVLYKMQELGLNKVVKL